MAFVPRRRLGLVLVLGGLALGVGLMLATTSRAGAGVDAEPPPDTLRLDTASLATGPYARMEGLLERTIFQVDVLTLTLRVGPETAGRLEELAAGRQYSEARGDSAAALVLEARDVYARMRFHRDVSLEQLLDGIRDNMDRALDAGIIGAAGHGSIADSLGRWYAPLRERGVREEDAMIYRIRGDSLRVVYRSRDGRILLDQLRIGPAHRLSVLGGYFAPGADLRDDLLHSLFRERGEEG